MLAIAIITVTLIQTISYLIKRNIKPLLSSFTLQEQQLPKIEQIKQSNYNYYNIQDKNRNNNIKRKFIN